MVILSSREHVEEVCTAPEDTLSWLEGINDVSHHLPVRPVSSIECHKQQLQVEYTLGYGIHHNPYHIPVVCSQLSRNLGTLYPEISNEMIAAFDDILVLRDDGKLADIIHDRCS